MTKEYETAAETSRAGFDSKTERTLVAGSPHLKHTWLGAIYGNLILETLASLSKSPINVRVLECGAGDGLASREWFENRVQLTAVDVSSHMLSRYKRRAAEQASEPELVNRDILQYLSGADNRFDVITFVSFLHHVPDYLYVLRLACNLCLPGGAILSFQDPLRFDTMPRAHYVADRAAYFAWRLFQGNMVSGTKTRLRRLRSEYSHHEAADFDEYHAVRNGVDSKAIVELLKPMFASVRFVQYWSTNSSVLQMIGRGLGLRSNFGVIALGRNHRQWEPSESS
jgi:ubiquinone/menaquinone biosynthesis C-methylase UbiE